MKQNKTRKKDKINNPWRKFHTATEQNAQNKQLKI